MLSHNIDVFVKYVNCHSHYLAQLATFQDYFPTYKSYFNILSTDTEVL